MDAEDESLARWKASLGIVPGATGAASGPKVRQQPHIHIFFADGNSFKVTVLSLELHSPTLPAGKAITFDVQDKEALAAVKKHPITIKEGIEYKLESPTGTRKTERLI